MLFLVIYLSYCVYQDKERGLLYIWYRAVQSLGIDILTVSTLLFLLSNSETGGYGNRFLNMSNLFFSDLSFIKFLHYYH